MLNEDTKSFAECISHCVSGFVADYKRGQVHTGTAFRYTCTFKCFTTKDCGLGKKNFIISSAIRRRSPRDKCGSITASLALCDTGCADVYAHIGRIKKGENIGVVKLTLY